LGSLGSLGSLDDSFATALDETLVLDELGVNLYMFEKKRSRI
jgi:hypothetical protein